VKRTPLKRKTPLRPKRKEPADFKEEKPMAASTLNYSQGDVGELRAAAVPHIGLRRGVMAKVDEVVRAAPKNLPMPGGKAEREHKEALAQLGCMVCRRLFPFLAPGPVELHHLRGGGWGKGDYTTLIPLCAEHHRGGSGVHGLGTKGFVKRYGFTQGDLLADACSLLEGYK
jgi:hypothetical protein